MPDNVASRLVAIERNFLWGSKQAKVAWSVICLPTHEGGLGIRDLGMWNTTLHAKILWKVHAKTDSLWIKWIHTEIIKDVDFWEWQPHVKEHSTLIKHIFSIRDEMIARSSREETQQLLTQWNARADTKAAYDWFRPREDRRFWAKYIWHKSITPKYSFIAWLALRGRLSTRDRITWEDIDATCSLCARDDESADHLFFRCRETWSVWDKVRDWIGLRRRPTTIKRAIKWLVRDGRPSRIPQLAGSIALMSTIYYIWIARNSVIMEGKTFDIARVLYQIKTTVYSILYAKFPHDQVLLHVPDVTHT
ncbi:uncharacterized protein LOC125188200 [Salvia hispanica]|uniref:uncharacterized protein LOC125188200 n=1 Tax=Salvia hispanica TaxID=49212 RepID=UPI002009218C|nr:uncharacterized protein LOC125188200 [Salvia hispanica]